MDNAQKKLLLLIICFTFLKCGESEEQILKEFNSLKTEVRKNYKNNVKDFDGLKKCFQLRYIRYIEFKSNGKVVILTKHGLEWNTTEDAADGAKIEKVFENEELGANILDSIKTILSRINANTIEILDLYDVQRGFDTQAFETRYNKEVNDLSFYYKVFSEPLDSLPSSLYYLQTDRNVGGILDKNVIYYYR